MFVQFLSLVTVALFLVDSLHAQPDPFQPLKPKKEDATEEVSGKPVTPPQCVSLVAESQAASKQRATIDAALNSQTSLDLVETPLTDVVAFLRNLHDIPILIDLRALEDVGMAPDVPVTIRLDGVTLRSALHIMLRDLGLAYVVADGVLQLTTPESAESRLVQHVYPVGDLADPEAAQSPGCGYLADLIQQTVAVDSWADCGGAGVIVPVDHLSVLVISQTTEVHQRIADLIVTLRRVREVQAD
jgi:hypothetical protein